MLEEGYFWEDDSLFFTRDEIGKLGDLLDGMLRFEPSERYTPGEALADEWFTTCGTGKLIEEDVQSSKETEEQGENGDPVE